MCFKLSLKDFVHFTLGWQPHTQALQGLVWLQLCLQGLELCVLQQCNLCIETVWTCRSNRGLQHS